MPEAAESDPGPSKPPAAAAREQVCPLCGGPNGCAPARSGSLDTPCWCAEVTITAEVLAGVPLAARGRACICAACAGKTKPD